MPSRRAKILTAIYCGLILALIGSCDGLTETNALECGFAGFNGSKKFSELLLVGMDRKESTATVIAKSDKKKEVPAVFDRETVAFKTAYPDKSKEANKVNARAYFNIDLDKFTGIVRIESGGREEFSAYGRCKKTYVD